MTAPTLDASGISTPIVWAMFSREEVDSIFAHHRTMNAVARYAQLCGKQEVQIVGDDSPEDTLGYGFKAVIFRHNGIMVTARTVFDVQYYYS
jgi:hypothetical protein